jgi:hypothetical protein
MMYKKLIAFLLLVPVFSYGNSIATEQRIQELKKVKFEKQLEISNLGKTIAEKTELIVSFKDDTEYLLELLLKQKILTLKKAQSNASITDEQQAQILLKLQKEANEFVSTFYQAYEDKKNIKGMLTNACAAPESQKPQESFAPLKFYLVRWAFEHDLFESLIQKYESLIQDLIEIEKELKSHN